MSNQNKVALITGANKGIGLEIARQLGQQGLTVLVGARDAARGEEAALGLRSEGIDARFIPIDLNDTATLGAAAKAIEADFGKLDVLVNNAGIAPEAGAPLQSDLEVARQTFETNFFGQVAVSQALVPLLRLSEAGRVVNLSSGLGSLAVALDTSSPYYGVEAFSYRASKSALNMFTVTLAKELQDTPIKVNAACPGYTATELNGFSGPRTVEQAATEPVRLALLPEDGPTGGFFNEDGPLPW
jgi:NAD(P)-dependent dehydrogenase (short-subunit alcohol dehydrogenase family)